MADQRESMRPTIPICGSSLGVKAPAKKELKNLKRSRDSIDEYADPEGFWAKTEEIYRLEHKYQMARYREMREDYRRGIISEEEWRTFSSHMQIHMMRTDDEMLLLRKRSYRAIEKLSKEASSGVLEERASAINFVELLFAYSERGVKRNKSQQTNWKNDLIQATNASEPGNPTMLWCPILKKFAASHERKAAHIVPYFLHPIIKLIFGGEEGPGIWSVRNGLIMSSKVEGYFDEHKCVIVPAGPMVNDRIDRWKLRVLDHSKSPPNSIFEAQCDLRDLDGTELEFRSDLRPSASYLFFHYASAILKARKSEAWSSSIAPGESMWATPNKYLRASMLRAMADQAGIETEKCWEVFSDALIPETEKQSVDEIAAQRAAALVLEKREGCRSEPGEESDDEA